MKVGKLLPDLTSFCTVTVLMFVGSLSAQPFHLDTPEESPLWWTLTDEVSPAELRAALRNPRAHLKRYQEALDAGVAQELTTLQVEALSFYYNRKLTPELTPMWVAFVALADGHVDLEGEDHTLDELDAFGFGSSASATIVEFARNQRKQTEELSLAIAPKSRMFVQVQREAIEAKGGNRRAYTEVKRAAERGDLAGLARSSGISMTELSDLRTAWLRLPTSETAAQLLPELRSRLGADDWERFRRFLLEHVVPNMGSESRDFDSAEGR